jgi:hypothetical protein
MPAIQTNVLTEMFDMWRVPTLLGVMACSALVHFAAIVIASIAIRRSAPAGRRSS